MLKLKNGILIVDPIAFTGGSKVASEAAFSLVKQNEASVYVMTRNKSFWRKAKYNWLPMFGLVMINRHVSGLLYFVKHFWNAIQIALTLLLMGRPAIIAGISGPGVDLSIYWVAKVFNIKVVQFIHGPVAQSRTVVKNLRKAAVVVCLESELAQIEKKLNPKQTLIPMCNGLPSSAWPTTCKSDFVRPHFFWAASILKWKGLDLFQQAFSGSLSHDANATVCFIRPRASNLPVSPVPVARFGLEVYEEPSNIDILRKRANIFISTSHKEPFGLSILESLAAGLCVVIPADGAYWDQTLEHGVNCIKYSPHNANELKQLMKWAQSNMDDVRDIAQEGQKVASQYRAENKYAEIVKTITSLLPPIKDVGYARN